MLVSLENNFVQYNSLSAHDSVFTLTPHEPPIQQSHTDSYMCLLGNLQTKTLFSPNQEPKTKPSHKNLSLCEVRSFRPGHFNVWVDKPTAGNSARTAGPQGIVSSTLCVVVVPHYVLQCTETMLIIPVNHGYRLKL